MFLFYENTTHITVTSEAGVAVVHFGGHLCRVPTTTDAKYSGRRRHHGRTTWRSSST